MPTFHYTLDDEAQETTEHELTPSQILTNAQLAPATHYLVQIEGKHRESYEHEPTEQIHMHEHMVFVSVFTGPTTVS